MRGEVNDGVVLCPGMLPKGWQRVRLADVGTWLSGGTPSTSDETYWTGDIPWISAASLKQFHIADSERRVTKPAALSGSQLVSKGATLFIVRGMSLKSEFRVGVAAREVAFGQDCKAIVPDEGVDPLFLGYALQALEPKVLTMVEPTSHGTGRLDTLRLQELEIGLPSLEEQHRIVEAHAAFERRIAALERVREKLAASGEAATTAALAAAESTTKLGGWLVGVETGRSPLADSTPAGEGEWGVLKVSAVQGGWLNPKENKAVRDSTHFNAQYEVRSGDLLMTRANTEDLVGRSCIAEELPSRLMLSDKTLRLCVDRGVADPSYVQLALTTPAVRSQIQGAATGSTGSMKNISQQVVRHLEIPDVPLVEQHKIVAARGAVRQRREVLRRQVEKLRQVQRAVTEDLLSGRVPVSAAWAASSIRVGPSSVPPSLC